MASEIIWVKTLMLEILVSWYDCEQESDCEVDPVLRTFGLERREVAK